MGDEEKRPKFKNVIGQTLTGPFNVTAQSLGFKRVPGWGLEEGAGKNCIALHRKPEDD